MVGRQYGYFVGFQQWFDLYVWQGCCLFCQVQVEVLFIYLGIQQWWFGWCDGYVGVWMLVQQYGQCGGQQCVIQCGQIQYVEFGIVVLFQCLGVFDDVCQVLEVVFYFVEQCLCLCCGFELVVFVVEKGIVKQLFQLCEVVGEGGLGGVQQCGSVGDVVGCYDCVEDFDVVVLDFYINIGLFNDKY